jgi:CRISPR-associated endonuclease Cas1
VPRCEDAFPLYVQEPGAFIKKKGGVLEVRKNNEKLGEARLEEISQVALFGPVAISTPAIHELIQRGISVNYHSAGGWFIGRTEGMWHKNVDLRTFQYQKSFDPLSCLRLARSFVQAKIANCRTLLRRNRRDREEEGTLFQLNQYRSKAEKASSIETLLGIEGGAAATYFSRFSDMLSEPDTSKTFSFDFSGRNRRPPKDAVNTMLSFAYAMLTREWTNALASVGFDPYRGFYHQPRFGRPSLALDMMESFRPIVADSVVITAINNKEIKIDDFYQTPLGCTFSQSGKKQFIQIFERRLAQEITHPIFGYRITYRRLFEVQARLLGRFLAGEIDDYPDFMTR